MSILDKVLGSMDFSALEGHVATFFRHAEQMTAQVNALRQQVTQLQNDQMQLRGQLQSIQSALLRIENQCRYR